MRNRVKLERLLRGNNEKNGILKQAILYLLLCAVGFIFLYPILYMLVHSFMSPSDLVNPAIAWIPHELYFENYARAFRTLDFFKSFGNSLYITVISTVLQTAAAALTGYGLARFELPMKKLIMALVLLTFIIPTETTLIPRYILFESYKILETPLTLWLPALTGQGLKSAVFILVFYQIFNGYPVSIDEAAELDGAGKYRTFGIIALPIARAGIVLNVLFSFVWYWNETRQSGLFFGTTIKTLPMKLGSFAASYKSMFDGADAAGAGANVLVNINEAVTLAGTMLSCIPILLLFLVLQRQFVESIEKSGITGE